MKTAEASNAQLTGTYHFHPTVPSLPLPKPKPAIVGVCGNCGGNLLELPIFDTTYRREYAKCEDCGTFHGQLPANAIETRYGRKMFETALFWNPVL